MVHATPSTHPAGGRRPGGFGRAHLVRAAISVALLLAAAAGVLAVAPASSAEQLRSSGHDQQDGPRGVGRNGPADLDVALPDATLAKAEDTCEELLYEIQAEHTAVLEHWNSEGVPSGKVWDLTFEICRPAEDPAIPHHKLEAVRDGIDVFIDKLQTHFIERDPQTWESELTECYAELGTTYLTPAGVDPSLDLPVYQPIIGYQLGFDQDPRITIIVEELDALGQGLVSDFPTDPDPNPWRYFMWLDLGVLQWFTGSDTAEVIAHELGHNIGYEHEEDGQAAAAGYSLSYAIGRCLDPIWYYAPPEPFGFGAELPDSGHGGEIPQNLQF